MEKGLPFVQEKAETQERVRHFWYILTFASVFLAAVLRLLRIDAAEPWLDEACTVHYATLPWDAFVESFATESHPPFYYLLMRLWIMVFGLSPVSIRMPSLIAGVIIVLLCIRLGTMWFGFRAGIVAGLFAAISPLSIHYSVEARQIALTTCLALAAVERLETFRKRRLLRDAFTYVLVGTLALYTHYYAIFVVPLVPVVLLKSRRASDLSLAAAPLVLYVPWLIMFVTGHIESGSKAWLRGYWEGPLDALSSTFAIMGGAAAFPVYLGPLGAVKVPSLVSYSGPVISVVLLLLGLMLRTHASLALACWCFIPIVAPIAVSEVLRPIYLPGRYELVAIPAFFLLMAAAMELPQRFLRWLARGAACAWAIAVIAVLWRYMPLELAQPQRAAHSLLLRERDSVAQVIAVGFTWATIAYLERQEQSNVPIYPVPRSLTDHPGWWDHDASRPEPEELAPLPSGPGAVWVMTLRGDGFSAWAQSQAIRLIEAGYRPEKTIAIGDVRLRVFQYTGTSN